jgi:flagellar assembly factor FliW
MVLETVKFGSIEYCSEDVIEMVGEFPGFKHLSQFVLIDSPEFEPIKFLQAVKDPHISFPIIDPKLIRSDYSLSLNQQKQEELELKKPEEGLVFSIVTLSQQPEKATVNLFAPIVFNTSNMKATQILLLDSSYSVEEPLLGD